MVWWTCAGERLHMSIERFSLVFIVYTNTLCILYKCSHEFNSIYFECALRRSFFALLLICHRHLTNQNAPNRLRITADQHKIVLKKRKSHLQLGKATTYWEPMYEHGLANKLIGGREAKMCKKCYARDGLCLTQWDILHSDNVRNDFSSYLKWRLSTIHRLVKFNNGDFDSMPCSINCSGDGGADSKINRTVIFILLLSY